MGGLFGGLLGLLNWLGGKFLYILIGSSARKDVYAARTARLFIGSTVLGLIAGAITYLFLPVNHYRDEETNAAWCFLGIPFFSFVLVIALELLRFFIEKDEKNKNKNNDSKSNSSDDKRPTQD